MSSMIDQFLAARRAGTPLIAIKTFDQEATVQALQMHMSTNGATPPIIQHDLIRGMVARNDKGVKALGVASGGQALVNPIDALVACLSLPFEEETNKPINPIVFILNAQAYLDASFSMRPEFIQALHNIRTPFRDSLRSLVLIGPEFNFPAELQHDILVLDEPLPTEVELSRAVRETCESAPVPFDDDLVDKAVGALRGLVAWEAEQATALSIALHKKLNVDELWQRKKQMISTTKGLTVWVGGQTFDGLGGLEEIKKRFRRRIAGQAKPRVIVWIDEIEKAMAGAGGAEIGNSTQSDQLGVILGEMQDKEYSGVLLVGVMGAAKSAFAKAIASEAECITIKLDLGAARGEGLVGQAENDIRQAFKVIEAVGGIGGALIVATSNDIRVVKPELKRRMNLGIWYFDIPTDDEKKVIVEIYKKKYPDVDSSVWDQIDTKNWTGAEIEIAFKTAHEDGCSLIESASTIIPVAISGKDDIARLRQEADGRYNSTNHPGPYKMVSSQQTPSTGRKIAQE